MAGTYCKEIVECMLNDKISKEIKIKKINYILKLDKECINNYYKRKTPLYWANEIGDQDFIDLLTSHNAIANKKEPTLSEQFALDREFVTCVTVGNFEKAQELLDEGAHVEASIINYKRNPLIVFCAGSRNAKTVEFLLNNGAFVDTIDYDGITPLINAIIEERYDNIKLLVERGANISAPFANNKSAYDWATNDDIKKIILEARKTWCTQNEIPFVSPEKTTPQNSQEKPSILSRMRSFFDRE